MDSTLIDVALGVFPVLLLLLLLVASAPMPLVCSLVGPLVDGLLLQFMSCQTAATIDRLLPQVAGCCCSWQTATVVGRLLL